MSQSHGKVLIVDDESAIRRALHNTLHGMGFEVDDAATGEAALHLVREAEYDVVLMDINMPGIGGIRACREIRKSLPRLGILMLTVRDREDDKITALDAGADDYITKPFQRPRTGGAHTGRGAALVRFPCRSGRRNPNWEYRARSGSQAGSQGRRAGPSDAEGVRPAALSHGACRTCRLRMRGCCMRCGVRSTEASWSICGRSSASCARSSRRSRLSPRIC